MIQKNSNDQENSQEILFSFNPLKMRMRSQLISAKKRFELAIQRNITISIWIKAMIQLIQSQSTGPLFREEILNRCNDVNLMIKGEDERKMDLRKK